MANVFDFNDVPKVIMEFANGPKERVTLDGLWTEEELKDNIHDECIKSKEFEKYKHRALKQPLMLLPDYMATAIIDMYDIIDKYNEESVKDRSKFGIAMFDAWIHSEIKRLILTEVVE